MDVERVADPETFLNRAGEFLLADEARHNLMFGIVHSIAHYPGIYPEWNLWVVDRAGHTVGVAVRMPPQNLVIARPAAEEVLDALADALAEHDAALPGVTAAQPEVDDFAHGWVARAGGSVRRRMVQGIYSLDAVNDVPTAVGRARVAGPSDFDEMLQLIEEFQREIGVEWSRDDDRARRALEGRLTIAPRAASGSGRPRAGRYRSPDITPRLRQARGSGPCTRRLLNEVMDTRRIWCPSRAGGSCPPVDVSASSIPTWRTRRPTQSIVESDIGKYANQPS